MEDEPLAMLRFRSGGKVDELSSDDYRRPDKKITMEERFAALHAESKKLNAGHFDDDDAIPNLNLQPNQLYESSVRLRHKVARMVDAVDESGSTGDTDIKAFKYLAQRGFDSSQLKKDIQAVPVPKNFEPYEPLGDTDVEGYLNHHYHVVVLTAAEEARRSTVSESGRNFESVLDEDWNLAKEYLKQTFGTRAGSLVPTTPGRGMDPADSFIEGMPTPRKSLGFGGEYEGTPAGGSVLPRKRAWDESKTARDSLVVRGRPASKIAQRTIERNSRVDIYAHVIRMYNGTRKSDGSRSPFAIATMLHNGLLEKSISEPDDAITSWQVLVRVLGEDQFQTDPEKGLFKSKGIGEQQYAVSIQPSRVGPEVGEGTAYQQYQTQMKLLRGSIRSLTWQFKLHVHRKVKGNREPAFGKSRSGVPSILADVERYVKSAKLGSAIPGASSGPRKLEEQFWPVLFYLLRCGSPKADLDRFFEHSSYESYRKIVETEARTLPGDSIMDHLRHMCVHFVERTSSFDKAASPDVTPDLLRRAKQIRERWSAHSSRGDDVASSFRDAVLNLVSFDDPMEALPSRGDNVGWTMEDFLWQKLSFVLKPIEGSVRGTRSDHSLNRWSQVVIESERQFVEGGKSPYVYFRALIYCLEFERAVAFLATAAPRAARLQDRTNWFADAVHMALALKHYGVLRQVNGASSPYGGRDESSSAFLTMCEIDPNSGNFLPHVRLDLLASKYLRHFIISSDDSTMAFEYLFALLWTKIIGTISSDATIPPHLLSLMVDVLLNSGHHNFDEILRYLDNSEQARLTTQQCRFLANAAAKRAMEHGLVKEAIQLWSRPRIGKYVLAAEKLNEQLSVYLFPERDESSSNATVATGSGESGAFERERKELLAIAERFYVHVQEIRNRPTESRAKIEMDALKIFIELYGYIDRLNRVPPERAIALAMIQNQESLLSSFIPSRHRDLDDAVETFGRAAHSLKQKMPQLLLVHMKCLRELHAQTRRRHRQNTAGGMRPLADSSTMPVDSQSCLQLRSKAALLVKFASMIDGDGFSIPTSVYAALSSAHISME